jgi:hypothetical protein
VTDEQRSGRAKDPPLGESFFATGMPLFFFIFIRLTPLRAFMRWLLGMIGHDLVLVNYWFKFFWRAESCSRRE